MERLTEEKQIGPWASLKDKAEAKVGAFADYDCLMAHMTAVTRLKYYEDLEEQGRLVVLPCKLGADVFRLGAKEVCAHWQTAYAEVYPDEIVMVDDSDNLIFVEDIGKTVFLTREEAEKALKEGAS